MIAGTTAGGDARLSALRFLVTVLAIWLGSQVVIELAKLRAPPEAVANLPGPQAEVLGRLAESRLAQGELESAGAAAAACIRQAPFSMRCARVAGLVAHERGLADKADQYLTIAGNWSLRDDQTHAWLVERRLRQGSYSSAFAHADALLRRRGEYQELVFPLFTQAATLEPRGFSELARRLSELPPWHDDYFLTLSGKVETLGLGAGLLLALLQNGAPVPDSTSELVLANLDRNSQVDLLRRLKSVLGDDLNAAAVVDGDFGAARTITPFTWELLPSANWAVAKETGIGIDDGSGLHVALGGFPTGVVARQTIFLDAGEYDFSVWVKGPDTGPATATLRWIISCRPQPSTIMSRSVDGANPDQFTELTGTFFVSEACKAQTVSLYASPAERRLSADFLFDRLVIRPETGR